ncbi:MAG: response regulator, partial [Gemmatimonadaceae bacterium]|nr:response regulator [Acetobacteraceae bacterium]
MTLLAAKMLERPGPASAPLPPGTVRVLLCDDSAVVRAALQRHLHTDPLIRVVAKAVNGQAAIDAVSAGGIDVVVLDIEMPVMDGLTALPHLLKADRAVRVLMSSTLTTQGAAVALEALRLGAADFIPKPTAVGGPGQDAGFREELIAKVAGLGRQAQRQRAQSVPRAQQSLLASPQMPALVLRPASPHRPLVLAIGSSTGGPAALLTLFRALGDR